MGGQNSALECEEVHVAHHLMVATMQSIVETVERTMVSGADRAELHVQTRVIEFERNVDSGKLVLGDTVCLLHIAARNGTRQSEDCQLHVSDRRAFRHGMHEH